MEKLSEFSPNFQIDLQKKEKPMEGKTLIKIQFSYVFFRLIETDERGNVSNWTPEK